MANYTVRVSRGYNEGTGQDVWTYTTSVNMDLLRAGDRVYLEAVTTTTEPADNVTLTGFSSEIFTSTSQITPGQYRTVKSGVPQGTSDYIQPRQNGFSIGNVYVAVNNPDSLPNPFGLTNKTNVDPKAIISVGYFQVTGINKAVTATVSGSGSREVYMTKNTKPREYTTMTVNNGDYINVYAEAEYDYNELSRTVSVTVGDRTETITVTTRKYPLPEQVIYMGISSPEDIYLKAHIATFFGGNTEPKLTDYLRGNFLVPSIKENEHVPTSPPIYLTDLYDTASALYFIYKPPYKRVTSNTISSAKSVQLTWNIVDDYNVGYGKLAEYLEYRYEFTSDGSQLQFTSGEASDVTLHSTAGSPGTWSQNNGAVWLKVSAPKNSERHYQGTITFYCRNAIDTSLVISRTVNWTIFFYGP